MYNPIERRLPAGSRVYAVGDIHGRCDLLDLLLQRIYDDVASRPCQDATIVFLGDYMDRGPASAEVLNRIAWLRGNWPVVCLMGNHDTYALRFIEEPGFLTQWAQVGGRETLRSFGLSVPSPLDARTIDRLANDFSDACAPHLAYLSSLPPSFSLSDYFFCHAGVRPGTDLRSQTASDLMTIREPFLSYEGEYGKLVVHGHTEVRRPTLRHNRIGIDTAAYKTSRLTCLIIEEAEIRFI